ncbi:MAG: hypothetical protein EHM19_09625, partial [Candidatus Latescibacterota bacterium]
MSVPKLAGRILLASTIICLAHAADADASAARAASLRPAAARIDAAKGGESPRAPIRRFPGVIGSGGIRPVLPGSGRTYADLLKGSAEAPATTFRVAVFRVEYENDSAGDATTGDGRFLLSADG